MSAERIVAELKRMETERKIHVIYAVEHGSRRWGLNGPVSDNDIGFIYVNPLDWYLKVGDHRDKSLESERDNIKTEIEGVGDFQGWDIKKALNAMHKGDPMLSEWLHAPEAYIEDMWTMGGLRVLAEKFWSPLKFYHRNVSTAKKNFYQYVQCDHHPDVSGAYIVKKWLHTLRPLLNALWMERTDGIPPADFTVLLHHLHLPYGLTNHIQLLAAAKRRGEGDDVLTQLHTTLFQWMETEITRLSSTFPPRMQQQQTDITLLDANFCHVVKVVNNYHFDRK